MITMEDIIRDGHPTLRKVAKEVSIPPSEEDVKILDSLLEYLINSQDEEIAQKCNLRPGIGLAAPQINVSKRIIAIHVPDEKGNIISHGLFNPRSSNILFKKHISLMAKAVYRSMNRNQVMSRGMPGLQ